jgi:hypothetical protein
MRDEIDFRSRTFNIISCIQGQALWLVLTRVDLRAALCRVLDVLSQHPGVGGAVAMEIKPPGMRR